MTLNGPQKGQLGFGDESTYGTAVTPTHFLPLMSEDTDKHYVPIMDESVFAGRRMPLAEQEVAGNLVAGGSFQTAAYPEGLRKLLTALFGTETDPGSGDPRAFVYTPGDLSDDSLTIEINAPSSSDDSTKTFDGCAITGATLEIRQNQLWMITWDFVAQDMARSTSAATAATFASVLPFKAVGNTFTITDVTSPCVKSLRIRIDNALADDRRSITTDEIKQPIEAGIREVTADLVLEYDDTDPITAHEAHTEIDLAVLANVGSAGLQFDLHGFVQPGVGQKLNTRTGLLEHNVPVKAFADAGGGTDADAVTVTYTTSEDVP